MASDTKQRMVATMARLLQRQGYAATGLNQVVAEAKAPKGSMYFHFPDGKAELAAEAITSSGSFIALVLREQLGRRQGTARAIEQFVDALIQQLEGSAFVDGCPIATVALEVGPTSDPLSAATSEAFGSWIDLVAARFRRDGLTVAAAHSRATLVVAAIEGGLVLAKAGRDAAPLRIVRSHVGRLCA